MDTHHNQTNKVYPVPKGVSVLNKVHYIRPPLKRNDQEYGNPRQSDVVKGYCSMEGVGWTSGTFGIVLSMKSFFVKIIILETFTIDT